MKYLFLFNSIPIPATQIDTFHDFVVLGSVDVVTNRFFGTTSTQAIFLDATDNSLFTCFDQYIPFESEGQ